MAASALASLQAKRGNPGSRKKDWIASELTLLAMTLFFMILRDARDGAPAA
jgi:hypothetical protein